MKDDSIKKDIPGPSVDHPEKYDVTPEGSLGLLALGHIGLRLWRDKRQEHFLKIKESKKKDIKEADQDG